MSTHAVIIAKSGDRYRGIYCHSDGYPDGVGKTLVEHYTDPGKVESLIALGDLSILGPTCHEPNPFNSRDPNKTCAYHRDRGEPHSIEQGATWGAVASAIDHEHAYVFEQGVWHWADRRGQLHPMTLRTEVRAHINDPLSLSFFNP